MEDEDFSSSKEGNLISVGVEFIRAMSEVYGAEKGMELYEKIALTLGDELKGKIFLAMLLGTHCGNITLKFPPNYNGGNAVPVIKAIRQYAVPPVGLAAIGLKEAKDLHDTMRDGTPIKININSESGSYASVAKAFRDLGCTVI